MARFRVFILALMVALLSACGGSNPTDPKWSVGGTVSGLREGKSVVLESSMGETLTVSANGSYSFAAQLPEGATFDISVKSSSAGLVCGNKSDRDRTIAAAASMPAAKVNWVDVVCFVPAELTAPGALPEGNWVRGVCETENATTLSPGARSYRAVAANTTSADTNWFSYHASFSWFSSDDCSGSGTFQLWLGSYSGQYFGALRTETPSDMAVYWGGGGSTKPTGSPPTPMIVVRKDKYLCMLDDTSPSSYADAASLRTVVDAAIGAGKCYTPM